MSQQVNLFNPIFLRQRKYFSARTMVQALGLILLGSLLLSAYFSLQSRRLEEEATATASQLTTAQQRLVEAATVYAPREKDRTLESAIAAAEAELESLLRLSSVLKSGDFGNTTGFAEYFRALSRQAIDGVWLTEFSIQGAGTDIGIQGRTLRPELVPAYLIRLKREPVMQGKSFATLEMQLPESSSEGSDSTPPYLEFAMHSATAGGQATAVGASFQ